MSYATKIPEVIDKIVEIIPKDIDEYYVSDGPPGNEEEQDMILIGFTFEDDTPSITVDIEQSNGMGRCKEQETYDISCAVISWSNDEDMKYHRDRALGWFRTVRKALKSNPKLDGDVLDCRVSNYNVAQASFPQGKGVYIEFDITVMVFVGFLEDEPDE